MSEPPIYACAADHLQGAPPCPYCAVLHGGAMTPHDPMVCRGHGGGRNALDDPCWPCIAWAFHQCAVGAAERAQMHAIIHALTDLCNTYGVLDDSWEAGHALYVWEFIRKIEAVAVYPDGPAPGDSPPTAPHSGRDSG